MSASDYVPLFETRPIKERILYRLFAASMLIGICFICLYRIRCFPLEGEALQKWSWFGLFLAEIWFFFYWFLSTPIRWYSVRRFPRTDRLSKRYGKELPSVDIFVCTADPFIEPPSMVVNTVLSVMAYDYPPEKLSVYLSDDGGSDLTFYAMLEAGSFAKIWLPFCNKFKVEPRSPEVYFKTGFESVKGDAADHANEWLSVKKKYEDMKMRIDTATELKRVPEELRRQHKGFREWDFVSSERDHQTIIQIIIDGRDPKAVDIEGKPLPTLVYLAREKRPKFHHSFKAGAMNALIRVSSKISNGAIILNVDCDVYSNNSESVKQSLCFFMDKEKGNEIAFVQYPPAFDNITKNEIYGGTYRVITKLEFPGMDANGGPCYVGSGCFHRRESLCGKKHDKDFKVNWKRLSSEKINVKESASVLEETCKVLASCNFEKDTQWGKEMGLKYGFAAEDIVTGLSIHRNGWKSIYLSPEREAFLGVSPTSLLQLLVQHKRWSEGHLQVFLSRYCSLLRTEIPLRLRLAYCVYNLWAANSFPTLYYVTVPCLCLLKHVSLFPKISSPWMLPFVYVAFAHRAYCIGEFLYSGGTFLGWCNDQRVWLFKRTTSYFFAFCDTILKILGVSDIGFVVTTKVTDDDVSERYEKELIEFGATSPMFEIIATIALLHLFSTLVTIKKVFFNDSNVLDIFGLQFLLSLALVAINLPVYNALFLRKDNGRMPRSVTYKSIAFALLAITIAMY